MQIVFSQRCRIYLIDPVQLGLFYKHLHKSQEAERRRKNENKLITSPQLSCVVYQMSCVTCNFFLIFFFYFFGQIVEASWLRVCYQRGQPGLVSENDSIFCDLIIMYPRVEPGHRAKRTPLPMYPNQQTRIGN